MLITYILLEVIKPCLMLKSYYHPNSVPFIICDSNVLETHFYQACIFMSPCGTKICFFYQNISTLSFVVDSWTFLKLTHFFSLCSPFVCRPVVKLTFRLNSWCVLEVVPRLENFCIPNMSPHVRFVYSWHTGLYTVTALWLSKSPF